jgi:TolB-like protein
MAQKSDIPGNFWRELKRRKVIHVITVYAAVAFVIMQVVNMVVQPLHLPDWTEALEIVLLCIGFVIALFLSWVYDITPSGVKKTKPLGTIKHVDKSVPKSSHSWKIATYISGVIIIALITINFIHGRNLNTNLEKSIAVLPFINDSPSDTNAYFINGIRSEILNHLQMVKDLRIISRTSTEQYRQSPKSIPEIARELKANYIVTGSGQKFGQSLSINVQLVRATNEKQLWSKKYDREIIGTKDIINVQSKIAQSIASELKTTITPDQKKLIEKVHTTSLTAYDLYERGRDALPEFWIEVEDFTALERAAKYYRKAIEFDSTFAEPYVGLAEVYYVKNYWSDYSHQNSLDSVLILADRALSYDENLSGAYFVKGNYFLLNGLKEDALKQFDKALELNPNDWMAFYGKGLLYEHDDYVKYLDNLQKALLIHPNGKESSTINRIIGGKLLETGFIKLALSYFTKAFELDRDSAYYLSCLGGTEYDQGNYKKSIEYCKRALMNKPPNYFELIDRLANGLYYDGQYREALIYFNELKYKNPSVVYAFRQTGSKRIADQLCNQVKFYCDSILQSNPHNYQIIQAKYDLSRIYAFKGDTENSIKFYRLYSQMQNWELWMVTPIRYDPLFNSLRNEPGFQQISREIDVKYQAGHERVRKWLEEQGMLEKGL